MEIVKVGEDDAKRIQDFAYLTWPDTFKEILTQDQIKYMLEWMYNLPRLKEQIISGHEFYIIRDDKDLGFIGIEFDHPESGVVKIHKLYVLPDQQGKGLGIKLFENIRARSIEEGMKSIQLNVNRFNRAVDFYHHIGFITIKEEDIDIGQGYLMEDYVMEYQL